MDVKKFTNDPLAFFEQLRIPSARGDQRFGDVMAEYQREWFARIAPTLLAVATGKKPRVGRFWCERTKGGSKDSDCACCLLWLLAFTSRPLDCQVGAADRDQANELKKAAADILRLNPWLGNRVAVVSWQIRCKATGSNCDVIATDVASSHGARPDVLIINELSHITQEDFAANLADNHTKRPNGLMIVASNSGFRGSWQERWRDLARDSHRWDFHALAQPAPWLSEAELEEAERRNSHARFNRLFHGIWVPRAGDALDMEDIEACCRDDVPPPTRASFYVAGLDLGVKHDHSALVVVRGDRDSQYVHVVEARRWPPDPATGRVDLIGVEAAIAAAHTRHQFRSVGYDPYQAQLMAQRLALRGVPMTEVTFSGKNLTEMATTMLETFRGRRITIPTHYRSLIDDLGRLEIEEKNYGHRLSATRDEQGHCDLATSLSIALPLAVSETGRKPIRAGAILEHDPNKPMGWREIADELDRKAGRIAGAAGWRVDSAQNENLLRALNDLHRTDPFFQQFRRR